MFIRCPTTVQCFVSTSCWLFSAASPSFGQWRQIWWFWVIESKAIFGIVSRSFASNCTILPFGPHRLTCRCLWCNCWTTISGRFRLSKAKFLFLTDRTFEFELGQLKLPAKQNQSQILTPILACAMPESAQELARSAYILIQAASLPDKPPNLLPLPPPPNMLTTSLRIYLNKYSSLQKKIMKSLKPQTSPPHKELMCPYSRFRQYQVKPRKTLFCSPSQHLS